MPDPAPLNEPAPSPAPNPAPSPNPAPAPAAAARPEGVPEKFWDAGTGTLRTDDLLKSYGEAQKLIGRKTDDVRAAVRSEYEAELFGKRPEKPEAYALSAPAEAQDVVIFTGPPPADWTPQPGQSVLQLNPDSKALKGLQQMAHRAGTSPEDFQQLLVEVARENGVRVPSPADIEADQKKVWGELGEAGQRRAQHVWGGMKRLLGDRAEHLEAVLTDARAIEAVEELLAQAGADRFAMPGPGQGTGPLTEASLKEMMKDPKYQTDPAYREQVTRGFKILYPD